MSADRLAEIKARADAATKGPWHWREGEPTSLVHVTSPRMHPWNILKAPDWGPTLADAEFIAAAREDVPWLVERVERLERWKAEALGIIDYRGEQQQRAEDERDNALAEVARLTAERDALAAQVTRVESLAEDWRYKGPFGWGAWQIGEGPDPEGYVMDHCASALRAALAGSEADTNDTQPTDSGAAQ